MNHPSDNAGDVHLHLPRIASLVPSLTELAFELGLGPCLVARTGYCVHPRPGVDAVPKVGGTKTVNLAKLKRLKPTQVWVNVDENRLELVRSLAEWGVRTVVTHPQGPEDHAALVDTLVQALADHPALQSRTRQAGQVLLGRIAVALECTRAQDRAPQRALVLIWREPWMTVARDTYIARLLARVNWQTWPAVEGGDHGAARYPVLRGDEDWLHRIERVLLPSEPYAFGAEHLDEVRRLCPRARVHLVDGEALTWWGPRVIEGLALLRRLADA